MCSCCATQMNNKIPIGQLCVTTILDNSECLTWLFHIKHIYLVCRLLSHGLASYKQCRHGKDRAVAALSPVSTKPVFVPLAGV